MKFKADEIASVIQKEIEQYEQKIDVREWVQGKSWASWGVDKRLGDCITALLGVEFAHFHFPVLGRICLGPAALATPAGRQKSVARNVRQTL